MTDELPQWSRKVAIRDEEISRLRFLNLQFAQQCQAERESVRVAQLQRNEAQEVAEELRCELRTLRRELEALHETL